jgi:hypothetical protein
LAKKISRIASAYAPLRRKTKRARERVGHDKDKNTPTTKQGHDTTTKNKQERRLRRFPRALLLRMQKRLI